MRVVSVPRRHPEAGGYARGDETRARIISAALRVFGERGYDQSSTRLIAAEAGVNPPALQYYFHSKVGLHRACAQHIIDRAAMTLAPALSQASEAIRSKQPDQAIAALESLLDALTDGLAAAGSESWSRFILRGKADGAGPAMGMIRRRIGMPLIDSVTRLIAIVTGCPASDESARLRALVILGQVNWIYANRDHTLTLMQWSKFDPAQLALVKSIVHEHTRAALRAICATGPGRK
jgi:AcrR family transcriptional regulator